jgi:DNA-binding NtrC family response regulator
MPPIAEPGGAGGSGAGADDPEGRTTERAASPGPREACPWCGACASERDGDLAAPRADAFDPTLSFREAKERAMAHWERWYLTQLLRYTDGNLSEAARIAHSDRGHLRKLARKHLGPRPRDVD